MENKEKKDSVSVEEEDKFITDNTRSWMTCAFSFIGAIMIIATFIVARSVGGAWAKTQGAELGLSGTIKGNITAPATTK